MIHPDDDKDVIVRSLRGETRDLFYGETLRLIRDIILVVSVFILFGVFVAQPVVVEGGSMNPQLHDGERLLVNKLVYYNWKSVSWGHIERGDVVVFWYPKDPEKSYVKRVIGLPGDTVELRNGIVFVNGNEMHEAYLDPEYNRSISSFAPRAVENHTYFVMGDNRDNSSDSRVWGLVPEKYIYGKVFFRYWDPSNIGFLRRGEYVLNGDNSFDRIVSADTTDPDE